MKYRMTLGLIASIVNGSPPSRADTLYLTSLEWPPLPGRAFGALVKCCGFGHLINRT